MNSLLNAVHSLRSFVAEYDADRRLARDVPPFVLTITAPDRRVQADLERAIMMSFRGEISAVNLRGLPIGVTAEIAGIRIIVNNSEEIERFLRGIQGAAR